MKILMVHPHDIYSPSEPWTIRIVSLAKELSKLGHKVMLGYCPLNNKELKNELPLGDIELFQLSRRAGIAGLLGNIRILKRYALSADIIHFQKCFHYSSIPSIFWGLMLNKPVNYDWDDWEEKIWFCSNNSSVHSKIFGLYIKMLESIIPRIVNTVTVSSGALEQLCMKRGKRKDRIFKVPVGADIDRFCPQISGDGVRKEYAIYKKLVVSYVGQLHAAQYAELFIEAAKKVLSLNPDTIFLVVGKGFRLSYLKELAAKNGSEKSIIFTDTVLFDKIPEFMAASDICVAPFEDNEITRCKSPLKIAEYMAAGKPIVASKVGEVEAMVADAGLLVDPGNVYQLADKISCLIVNNGLRDDLGRRGRLRAEKLYNWKISAKSLISAYEVALNNGQPS